MTYAFTQDVPIDAAFYKRITDGLGDEVTLFGGRKGTKADAVIALTSGWADHYSAAAMYLRLNGLVPPTAKPKE